MTIPPAGHSQRQRCPETPANGVPRHHMELARGLEPLTCCLQADPGHVGLCAQCLPCWSAVVARERELNAKILEHRASGKWARPEMN
jgi:hypothetical protein